MSASIIIFQLIALIFSIMVHEISHGAVALKLGDQTAKNAGRLTLNPLKHLDPVGSILLPLMMFFFGGPVFGWAKPVPYNPFNLKNPRTGGGLIAAAGPLSNILVAAVFGIFIRILKYWPAVEALGVLAGLFQIIVIINISLAIFNLVPIPPLDGSGILFSFLPRRFDAWQFFLTRYGFIILVLLIFSNSFNFIVPIIEFLYRLLAG